MFLGIQDSIFLRVWPQPNKTTDQVNYEHIIISMLPYHHNFYVHIAYWSEQSALPLDVAGRM